MLWKQPFIHLISGMQSEEKANKMIAVWFSLLKINKLRMLVENMLEPVNDLDYAQTVKGKLPDSMWNLFTIWNASKLTGF